MWSYLVYIQNINVSPSTQKALIDPRYTRSNLNKGNYKPKCRVGTKVGRINQCTSLLLYNTPKKIGQISKNNIFQYGTGIQAMSKNLQGPSNEKMFK